MNSVFCSVKQLNFFAKFIADLQERVSRLEPARTEIMKKVDIC